ncbi:hypothetical protein JW935_25855, partial [candidate division KSB1 bacterium]|nr:hypothetical protein [candidate division KSB1 bacterium]
LICSSDKNITGYRDDNLPLLCHGENYVNILEKSGNDGNFCIESFKYVQVLQVFVFVVRLLCFSCCKTDVRRRSCVPGGQFV